MQVWTYLTELCSFGHVPFEALEKTPIVGEEGAIAASTATARPRNAARAAGRHACCCATAGLQRAATRFGRL